MNAVPLEFTMRRLILALAAGLLFVTAGCGTARESGGEQAVPGVAPGPGESQPAAGGGTAVSAQAALCAAVGEVYGTKLGPFASALSEMVAAPAGSAAAEEARGDAQKALGDFAAEVRSVTGTTTLAEAKTAGAAAAEELEAKAADEKFFGGIKTQQDVEKVLGTTFGDWLEPLDQQCS